jgi:hypothetical protein
MKPYHQAKVRFPMAQGADGHCRRLFADFGDGEDPMFRLFLSRRAVFLSKGRMLLRKITPATIRTEGTMSGFWLSGGTGVGISSSFPSRWRMSSGQMFELELMNRSVGLA